MPQRLRKGTGAGHAIGRRLVGLPQRDAEMAQQCAGSAAWAETLWVQIDRNQLGKHAPRRGSGNAKDNLAAAQVDHRTGVADNLRRVNRRGGWLQQVEAIGAGPQQGYRAGQTCAAGSGQFQLQRVLQPLRQLVTPARCRLTVAQESPLTGAMRRVASSMLLPARANRGCNSISATQPFSFRVDEAGEADLANHVGAADRVIGPHHAAYPCLAVRQQPQRDHVVE